MFLVRAGAIIPMREYARAIELGSNRRLTLDVYPDGESAFTLYEDDGTSNEYLEGGFATTRFSCLQSGGRIVLTVDPVQGGHDWLITEREYRLQIHVRRKPRLVLLNGTPLPETESLPGWEYDASRGLIRAAFAASTSMRSQVALEF
jgi:alpha-glucosidase